MKVHPETLHFFTHVANNNRVTFENRGKCIIATSNVDRGDFLSGAGRCEAHLLVVVALTFFVFLGTLVTLGQHQKTKSLLSKCIQTARIDCECIYIGNKGFFFPEWVNKKDLKNRPLKFKNPNAYWEYCQKRFPDLNPKNA